MFCLSAESQHVCNNEPSIVPPVSEGEGRGQGRCFTARHTVGLSTLYRCWLLCDDQLLSWRMFPCQLKKYKTFFLFLARVVFIVSYFTEWFDPRWGNSSCLYAACAIKSINQSDFIYITLFVHTMQRHTVTTDNNCIKPTITQTPICPPTPKTKALIKNGKLKWGMIQWKTGDNWTLARSFKRYSKVLNNSDYQYK